MHNVHRGQNQREEQRAHRSGPSEEEQRDGAACTDAGEAQTLDLNHATIPQLEALDALGPALARAIVERRVHHGHPPAGSSCANWKEWTSQSSARCSAWRGSRAARRAEFDTHPVVP